MARSVAAATMVARHTFYEKSMASSYIIHRDSAMSWGVKRATIIGEIKRRMYNTDSLHTWQERVDILNRFCVKMLQSGYGQYNIYTLIKSGVGAYEKMVERAETGVCPLYRDKEYKAEQRWRDRIMKRSTWSGASSVLFIPFSRRLKEAVVEGVRRSGEKIKVVEQGGTSLKSILQKSDPFRETECTDPKCPVCTVKEGGQERCIKGSC